MSHGLVLLGSEGLPQAVKKHRFSDAPSLRAAHFESDETLWTHETNRSDLCLEGHANLARVAYHRGRLDVAIAHSDKALAYKAREVVAFSSDDWNLYCRGLILFARGDAGSASAAFRQVIARSNRRTIRSEAAYALALLALQEKDYPRMVNYLDRAAAYGAVPGSYSDILLLRSYANLKLLRLAECRTDFEGYQMAAKTNDTPHRRQMADEIREALGR